MPSRASGTGNPVVERCTEPVEVALETTAPQFSKPPHEFRVYVIQLGLLFKWNTDDAVFTDFRCFLSADYTD